MLDEQLGSARMWDNLLYLTQVDHESAVATDYHWIGLKRFLHEFHRGAKHVGMYLIVAQMTDPDVIAHSLYI